MKEALRRVKSEMLIGTDMLLCYVCVCVCVSRAPKMLPQRMTIDIRRHV